MAKIPLKPKKWRKDPINLKIDQNTPKPKNWLKYPLNLKNDKTNPET